MEPKKHPDDLVYEAVEKQMGWDESTVVREPDFTVGADFGHEDKTVIAVFHVERNEKGEPVKITRVNEKELHWLTRLWIWIRVKFQGR